MARCTWKECMADGVFPQLGKTGEAWALLCQEHHDELEKRLRAWALAGHGHQAREDFKRSASAGMQRLGGFVQAVAKAKKKT